jgi:hypothetical protein
MASFCASVDTRPFRAAPDAPSLRPAAEPLVHAAAEQVAPTLQHVREKGDATSFMSGTLVGGALVAGALILARRD